MRTQLYTLGLSLMMMFSTVSCKEDLGPIQGTADALFGGWLSKVSNFKKEHELMYSLVGKLPIFADPNSPAAILKGKLDAALGAQKTEISGLEALIGTLKGSVEKSYESGKVADVQGALDVASSNFDGAFKKLSDMFANNKKLSDELSKLAAPEIAKQQAYLQAVEAEKASIAKASKEGGAVDFSNIDFKVGSAEIITDRASSKETLDRLVGFFKSCPELNANITGHTSKDGDAKANQKLSEARAAAIKDYLAKSGIDAKKVLKTSGKGSTVSLVAEPEPNSDDAKKLDPAALEAIRNKNRRISVEVVTKCK